MNIPDHGVSFAAEIAAAIFCSLLAALTLFQVALVSGARLGRFAWGGQHDVLPRSLRIGSLVAIALYALLAVVILERAGLVSITRNPTISRYGAWAVTGYSLLGVGMNFISRSLPERYLMTPLAIALFGSSLVVALS